MKEADIIFSDDRSNFIMNSCRLTNVVVAMQGVEFSVIGLVARLKALELDHSRGCANVFIYFL